MSDTPQVDAFFNPRTVGELEWLTYNTVAAGLLSLARRLERESRSLASEMPEMVSVPRDLLVIVATKGRAAWPFIGKEEREAFNAVGALVGVAPTRVEPLEDK